MRGIQLIIGLAVFALFVGSCSSDEKKNKAPKHEVRAEIMVVGEGATSSQIEARTHEIQALLISDPPTLRAGLSCNLSESDLTKLRENLTAIQVDETTILQLRLGLDNERLGLQFLDSLLNQFLEDNLRDKLNLNSELASLLDLQIDSMQQVLEGLEYSMDNGDKILDLDRDADVYFEQYVAIDKEIRELSFDQSILESLKKSVTSFQKDSQLPWPHSLQDEFLHAHMEKLMEAVRNGYDDVVSKTKLEIVKYLDNMLRALSDRLVDLRVQAKTLENRIKEVPGNNKMSLVQEFEYAEELYTTLLEKKTEMRISRAAITPDIRITRRPYVYK